MVKNDRLKMSITGSTGETTSGGTIGSIISGIGSLFGGGASASKPASVPASAPSALPAGAPPKTIAPAFQPQQAGTLGITPQQAASPAFDLSDPFGICNVGIAGIYLCNNMGKSDNLWFKIFGGISIAIAVFFGDALDIFGWLIGLIPVVGELAGNTVLGNIIDAVVFVVLFFWIGFPAFLGLGEFTDILGFIPGMGDLLALIDWLPWWTWAVAVWILFQLLKLIKLPPIKLFSPKEERDSNPLL
jgi:hypothetical protein